MLRFYRTPAFVPGLDLLAEQQGLQLSRTERCFYVETIAPLDEFDSAKLRWLLTETFEPQNFSVSSFLDSCPTVLEFGPRLNFETAFSTTAVDICRACGIYGVTRMEQSIRIGFMKKVADSVCDLVLATLCDRMTQMPYKAPLESFHTGLTAASARIIPVLEEGRKALREVSYEMGFGWDDQDIEFCFALVQELGTNPTDVLLFQLAQANSDHSRHWFFRGKLVINGVVMSETLMDIIKQPWKLCSGNSLLAFCDDSSAIRGSEVLLLRPTQFDGPSQMRRMTALLHPTLTAETHNHPCAIAPKDGADTAEGGRIRDTQGVGRGGFPVACGAGYCTANSRIPGYNMPWESGSWNHPRKMASPLEILIEASNGCTSYGNCFGEPLIYGFARTYEGDPGDGYRGWFKPVVYSVGAGYLDDYGWKKNPPEKGMLVVMIGGPGYRIGVGGGAASSMEMGTNDEDLDFGSVQKGTPEMEQYFNRQVRACAEMGKNNPVVTMHDLGAGGACNAGPEVVDPAGAVFYLRKIPSGDPTLAPYEIWGNEGQERMIFLIWGDSLELVQSIAKREGVPIAVVGEVTGDGRLVLVDEQNGQTLVDVPLKKILGELPQKTFELSRINPRRLPLVFPENLSVIDALDRVLRLVAVASKRFLTTKGDRSVTGRIVQQQCVGPHHITLSDYAAIADSCFGGTGVALSLGEQPIKGMISPQAMARLALSEALLNLVGAKVESLEEVRCQANWMLAARQPGEGAWLYDAADSLRNACIATKVAPDGGKDSCSMAAILESLETGKPFLVKAPGELVIACYAKMPDINRRVTPNLKQAGNNLYWINLNKGKFRLGGSALAQVFNQVGDECPDVDVKLLKATFNAIQLCLEKGLIASLHDISDGGTIVALLEMAFAGCRGFNAYLPVIGVEDLFAEEPGLVLEISPEKEKEFLEILDGQNIPYSAIGQVGELDESVEIDLGAGRSFQAGVRELRALWEETSSAIDALQANPECVRQESFENARLNTLPPYHFSFLPNLGHSRIVAKKIPAAILRERGSNGDREMDDVFELAGFDVWDVTMTDLLAGKISLDQFRMIAFVGGFSFGDVLDAGKGWAGVIRFNPLVSDEFKRFREREDTLSLGVCNGCQMPMMIPGWGVPLSGLHEVHQPRFVSNVSGRFEARFPIVTIEPSSAVMLRGMEHSRLGVWTAHGEGRLQVRPEILREIIAKGLAPIRYADFRGKPTTTYPFNPNGSPEGVAALCSEDGRHLVMMPHPERTFQLWHWPWLPKSWGMLKASPWLRMFQNANEWCLENS